MPSKSTQSLFFLLLVVVVAATSMPKTGSAVDLEFDPGPEGNRTSSIATTFSDLNGTVPLGQAMTIDVLFDSPKAVVPILPIGSTANVSTEIVFRFDAVPATESPMVPAGAALVSDGSEIPNVSAVAQAGGGTPFADFTAFYSPEPVDRVALDGFSFDIVLPTEPGLMIIDTEFRVGSAGGNYVVLPEPAADAATAIGLFLIVVMSRHRSDLSGEVRRRGRIWPSAEHCRRNPNAARDDTDAWIKRAVPPEDTVCIETLQQP